MTEYFNTDEEMRVRLLLSQQHKKNIKIKKSWQLNDTKGALAERVYAAD